MMADPVHLAIDPTGSLQQVLATLGQAPANLKRAQSRAMSRFLSWIQRETLQAVSAASGVPQRKLKAMARYRAKQGSGGEIVVWMGTNPIAAQFLGKVTWNRRMAGARVGSKSFPHTWSWGPGSKTGSAVMERSGGFYAYDSPISGAQNSRNREGIREVYVPMHEETKARIDAIMPRMQEQLMRYMLTAVKEQIFQESQVAA